jgi:hypothetical protein
VTQELPEAFLQLCRSITSRRARVVIDHIIKHGHITTEDLQVKYGYDHPPRAIGDVRDNGILIQRYWVTSSDGRRIAAYRFSDVSQDRLNRLSGRRSVPRTFRRLLTRRYGTKCAICLTEFEERELQADHRIPFRIAGDPSGERNTDDYMWLCGSHNRAKSWSCEHCENWEIRDESICTSCYWAYPENHTHVAMREIRRVDIVWEREEIDYFNRVSSEAVRQNKDLPIYIKEIVAKYLEGD